MKYLVGFILLLSVYACNNNGTKPTANQPAASTAPAAATPPTQPQLVANDSQRIEYYSNGKEKLNTQLKGGKMEGNYRSYFENGHPKEKGIMAADQKNGLWFFYDSMGHVQQVAVYAKDKQVQVLDTADYNLTTKKLLAEKMQISVPHDWELQDVGEYPMVIIAGMKKCGDADHLCPNFTFTKEALNGQGSFEEFVAYGNATMKQAIPNLKVLFADSSKINGYKAYRIAYKGSDKTLKFGSVMTLYYNKDTVYAINCTAKDIPKGNFDKYQDLFIEISNSIKPL